MEDIVKLATARTYAFNEHKLVEECLELAVAAVNYGKGNTPQTRQNVIEEMADVLISIDVFRNELNITDAELTDMRHHKMVRNLQRIE